MRGCGLFVGIDLALDRSMMAVLSTVDSYNVSIMITDYGIVCA